MVYIYICVCVSYIYYIIYPMLYQYSIKNVDVSFHMKYHPCQPNDSTSRLSVGPVGPLEMEPLRYHRRGHAGSWPWRKHLGDRGDLGDLVGFLCFPVVFGLFLLELCWMMFGIWWCVLMTRLVFSDLILYNINNYEGLLYDYYVDWKFEKFDVCFVFGRFNGK